MTWKRQQNSWGVRDRLETADTIGGGNERFFFLFLQTQAFLQRVRPRTRAKKGKHSVLWAPSMLLSTIPQSRYLYTDGRLQYPPVLLLSSKPGWEDISVHPSGSTWNPPLSCCTAGRRPLLLKHSRKTSSSATLYSSKSGVAPLFIEQSSVYMTKPNMRRKELF